LIAPGDASDLGVDVIASGFFGVTLFHIKETQPDLFERVAHALLPTDYVRRRLLGGGEWATDPTNAFSAGLFNVREGRWHERAIQQLGLPVSIFPAVRPTEEVAGALSASAAGEIGLPAGVPVIYGGGDNQMSMIGSGAFAPDSPILLNLGTSGQFCAVIADYRKIDGLDTRSFPRGQFALVGAGLTGGVAYTWLRNTLAEDVQALGADLNVEDLYAKLDALAANASPGCDGLRFDPYLRGTRREPDVRAAFHGVSTSNFTIGNRALAVMEGVINELFDFYKLSGVTGAESMIGSGNGFVKSKPWRRVAAQIFELPLKVLDIESAVYGATLVAAEGLNLATLEDSL
ncbi:MAG: hypothetical protein KAH44_02535, partial [Oricola sp.]|nr:hypothetical protein [Oricola sp.]